MGRPEALQCAAAPYVEDAGFVKLREVTLAYALPPASRRPCLAGAHETVRLELSGRNLVTWTDYTGLDPEVSNFGSRPSDGSRTSHRIRRRGSFFFSITASF